VLDAHKVNFVKRPVDPDADTLRRRFYFGCLRLLPGRVSAAPCISGNQAELGGPADNRGAERGAGAVITQRSTGARRGQDAAGPRRVSRHAVQEDLHVQARKRVDTLRRHSRLHRNLVDLQRWRPGQDTQRTFRAIRSAQRTVHIFNFTLIDTLTLLLTRFFMLRQKRIFNTSKFKSYIFLIIFTRFYVRSLSILRVKYDLTARTK